MQQLLFLCCCFVLFFSLCKANRCPEPDSLKPYCHCNININKDNTPVTSCKGVYQLQVLKDIFSATGDRPLVRLEVTSSLINFFPASALKEKSMRVLHIDSTTLVSLFETDPEENHKLNEITLYKMQILRGIQWSQFKNFHNLSLLFTVGVTMKRLGKDFVENIPTSLRKITLAQTKVRAVHDEVFSTLSKVGTIELDSGTLTTLKRSMFPKQNEIGRLSFRNHKISNLPDDLFSDMPKLYSVSLGGNQITMLSESVFKVLADRNIALHLLPSPIDCDCSVLWATRRTSWELYATCEAPPELRFKDIKSLGPNWGCRPYTI